MGVLQKSRGLLLDRRGNRPGTRLERLEEVVVLGAEAAAVPGDERGAAELAHGSELQRGFKGAAELAQGRALGQGEAYREEDEED